MKRFMLLVVCLSTLQAMNSDLRLYDDNPDFQEDNMSMGDVADHFSHNAKEIKRRQNKQKCKLFCISCVAGSVACFCFPFVACIECCRCKQDVPVTVQNRQ